jgi:hypothetical protein
MCDFVRNSKPQNKQNYHNKGEETHRETSVFKSSARTQHISNHWARAHATRPEAAEGATSSVAVDRRQLVKVFPREN